MKLSSIFSDGMVLQRNKPITISGYTNPSQNVHVQFLERTFSTTSDQNGDWSINLGQFEPGGPYQLEIEADDKIVIQDILIGDVWILGGQSNMEMKVKETLDLFSEEMKAVHQPFIRQFTVPQEYNFHGPTRFVENGSWINASGTSVMDFSAAGYFFANEIYEKYGVPIGLIATAVGGSPIEAWISESTLREIGGYETELEKNKDDSYVSSVKQSDEKRHVAWGKQLDEKDLGLLEGWYEESFIPEGWKEIKVPGTWEETELENLRGSVWYRYEFELPSSMTESEAILALGTIIDADNTYINGTLIGNTTFRYPPRRYPIPDGILKPGKNNITVRVISTQTTGGFVVDMPYKISANGQVISLTGTWKYRIGAVTETLENPTFFQYKPAGDYNGLIAPISNYSASGVLWYQGESNTGQPDTYKKLFEVMVNDWRQHWPEIPFFITQLANYDTGAPTNKNWAELREQQRLSLDIPNTAMAVTIDIGEYNDLHPQDKKTLGQRLALCARKLVYKEDIVYSGPLYKSMEILGSEIHLTFDHIGSGLVVRGKQLNSFEIAEDGEFSPATAIINGDKVIVSNSHVTKPTHVRYGWLDNPDNPNLYNIEGLPASPFTTESN
ncbi:sialate O-acetylesterase [Fredinandcohnia sp. 179-A 10B2 NHS]|uniref:sialate O-acetylesterase n=1 Tax=Fredinandcohnia sp. 179-A 10B2 NHS TaxID=3235176 RepID=UPI00399F7579